MAQENPFLKSKETIEESISNFESLSSPNAERNNINRLPTKKNILADREAIFNSLIDNDDDDEEAALANAKATSTLQHIETENEKFDPILAMIEKNIRDLQRKHPTGGIKAARYINSEVLIAAPKNFFYKYETSIQEGSRYVRDTMGQSERAEIIRRAQENPTDDGYQDEAFYAVSSYTSEYLEKSGWRDIHRKIVHSMICNEILGFGRLEPLWRDRRIDEIICNGPYDIQVEMKGRLLKVPGCQFKDQAHLMSLMERLYGAIGKIIAAKTPIVEGRLHDKSRMNIVHTSIAPDGPNVNIRRHPEGFWTPEQLVNFGSAPAEMMTYLGNLIYKGVSVLVIGGTGSGKTSMLNSLTGFYNPDARIVTLEDNLEMKPNPKKMLAAAMETKMATSDSDSSTTMRTLVKTSLRMRPDVILVGEVRDDAAYDLSQALNTGHYGASTIHANSAQDAIPRVSSLISQSGLTTIQGALDMISAAFDIIVVTKRFPMDGSRKIIAIEEVSKDIVNIEGRLSLKTIPLWKFVEEGTDENRRVRGYWEQTGELSQERIDTKMLDIQEDLTWEELKELSSIPEGYLTHSEIV